MRRARETRIGDDNIGFGVFFLFLVWLGLVVFGAVLDDEKVWGDEKEGMCVECWRVIKGRWIKYSKKKREWKK